MINITIDDNYKIETKDNYNMVLMRKSILGKRSKNNQGQESWTFCGYYGTLKQALAAYVDLCINDENSYAQSITEITNLLNQINDSINKVNNISSKELYELSGGIIKKDD